jgi:hypothetical protein
MRRRCRARREDIGKRLELAEGTSPRGIKPPRCTSAELFFSWCDSIAALPALTNCNENTAKINISSREFSHMQASQCGNQMGTEVWELVCDEHGIGGDGEYFVDNDAQLNRIKVLYYEA